MKSDTLKEFFTEHNILASIFFSGLGILVLLACVFNWNWYFELGKAKKLVEYFGRSAARVIHGIVSLVLIFLSLKILGVL